MTTEERYEKYRQRCMAYVKKLISRQTKIMLVPAYLIFYCLITLWRICMGTADIDFLVIVSFAFTAIISVIFFRDTQEMVKSIMYFSKGWHIKATTGRLAAKRRKTIYAVDITAETEKYAGKKTKKKREKQKKQINTQKKPNLKFTNEFEIRAENHEEVFREGEEITVWYTDDVAINTPYLTNYDKSGMVILHPAYGIYAYAEDGTTAELMQRIAEGGQTMLSKKEILFRIYWHTLFLLICSVFIFACILRLMK